MIIGGLGAGSGSGARLMVTPENNRQYWFPPSPVTLKLPAPVAPVDAIYLLETLEGSRDAEL